MVLRVDGWHRIECDGERWILTDEYGGTWELRYQSDPGTPFAVVPLQRSDAWRALKNPHCTIAHEGPCNLACGEWEWPW